MSTMSVSLSGDGALPPALAAVEHATEHPDHHVILWLTSQPEIGHQSIVWACEPCDRGESWQPDTNTGEWILTGEHRRPS